MSIGDSLELARKAREFQGDVIAFCGVWFMAETAKVLNPDRIVVVPDREAGCSLVDSCTAEQVRAYRRQHPDHVIVSYINTSIEVKAESDILCTSRNAVRGGELHPAREDGSVPAGPQPGQLREAADRAREHEDLAGHVHRARDVPRAASVGGARRASRGQGGGPSGVPGGGAGAGGFRRVHLGHHRVLRRRPTPRSSSS